jgi:membrane protein involved in colicin uptake
LSPEGRKAKLAAEQRTKADQERKARFEAEQRAKALEEARSRAETERSKAQAQSSAGMKKDKK